MFITTLFFNDSLMHKIYVNMGKFNFVDVLPQIIFTIIICSIINAILKKLYMPQKNILEIKYEKNIDILNVKIVNIMKILNIKFKCFFLINIIFLVFAWYYLSCFCIIYINTQIYLFEVSLISFSFSLIIPFFIYLLPGIFRMNSLGQPEKCIYNISKIF